MVSESALHISQAIHHKKMANLVLLFLLIFETTATLGRCGLSSGIVAGGFGLFEFESLKL